MLNRDTKDVFCKLNCTFNWIYNPFTLKRNLPPISFNVIPNTVN